LAWVFFIVVVLSITESLPTEQLVFEAVSAFGTVGLSTGITPELSKVGQVLIMITMFLGRVGPLTVAFAIAEIQSEKESGKYRYPDGNLYV
ncbi:MAG TPA: hypothetical protein DHN33_03815, partial [Eubacteriaceae bacterium]|nr:hypothetical protein [Eubacteriaceae bacterium]